MRRLRKVENTLQAAKDRKSYVIQSDDGAIEARVTPRNGGAAVVLLWFDAVTLGTDEAVDEAVAAIRLRLPPTYNAVIVPKVLTREVWAATFAGKLP